jgi:hypothetical protein
MTKKGELVFLVEEDPAGGYNAKAVGQGIFVQGDTFEILKENIRDAVGCHFDDKKDGPDAIRLRIVLEETFTCS